MNHFQLFVNVSFTQEFPAIAERQFIASGRNIYILNIEYQWIHFHIYLSIVQRIFVFMIFSAKEEEDNLYLYIFSKSETIYRESFLYGCTRSTQTYHHSFYIENKCHIYLNVSFNDTNISLGKLVPHLLAHLISCLNFANLVFCSAGN